MFNQNLAVHKTSLVVMDDHDDYRSTNMVLLWQSMGSPMTSETPKPTPAEGVATAAFSGLASQDHGDHGHVQTLGR